MIKRNKETDGTSKGFVLGNTGSATVEAALLYPFLFLVVIYLLIAGTVWYQKTYFKAIVHECVQSVTLSVTENPSLPIFEKDDLRPLNQPVYSFGNTLNEMIRSGISKSFHEKKDRFVIYPFAEQETFIKTKVTNHVFYKQLDVEVEAGFHAPMAFLFGKTDDNGLMVLKEHAVVVIPDTSELSWSMDLVGDSLKRFDLKDKTDQLLTDLLRPLRVVLEKIVDL